MRMLKAVVMVCVLAIVVGACGKKGELEPPEDYRQSTEASHL